MAGGALFDRARSGLRLNPRGQALWQATRWALAELRQAEEELAALSTGEVRGAVVVGTLPFSTGLFLPGEIAAIECRWALDPAGLVAALVGEVDEVAQRRTAHLVALNDDVVVHAAVG